MNHERLAVYGQLLQLAEEVAKRIARWPRGYGYLADQLRRAMASSVLNLCEGNGKRDSVNERRRFFSIAKGSISETAACIDLARVNGLIDLNAAARLKAELNHAYNRIGRLP